jgi:hypothetical protein
MVNRMTACSHYHRQVAWKDFENLGAYDQMEHKLFHQVPHDKLHRSVHEVPEIHSDHLHFDQHMLDVLQEGGHPTVDDLMAEQKH